VGLQLGNDAVAVRRFLAETPRAFAGVPGYPTTTGYDLTTGWGSPQGFRYVDNLLNQP
jgi:hypothetical protein